MYRPFNYNAFNDLVLKTLFNDEKSILLVFFCGHRDRGSPRVFILPLRWLLLGYMPHYFKPRQLNRLWRCDGRTIDQFISQKVIRSIIEGFWNERYSREENVYVTRPNAWFKHQLDLLAPGKLLLPAEGEDRNAVFAAEKGWEVAAFDLSVAGRDKALWLAGGKGVNLTYHVGKFPDLKLKAESFDAVVLIFAHFLSSERKGIVTGLVHLLKPGGHLILECFSKKRLECQQKHGSRGRREAEMLYSPDQVKEEFSGLVFSNIEEKEIELNEGTFHLGKAFMVRIVATK